MKLSSYNLFSGVNGSFKKFISTKTGVSLLASLLSFRYLHDSDLWWHLRIGEYITQNFALPTQESLTIFSDLHYIYHSWLSEVILYLLYSNGGLWIISMYYLLLFFFSYYFIFSASTKLFSSDNSHWLILPCVPIFASIIEFRVQAISFLLLTYLYWLLIQKPAFHALSTILRFTILFIFWANLHGGFILGLLLYGYFLIAMSELSWFRKSGLLLILIIATCINPYNWKIWQQVIHMGTNAQSMLANYDWSSILTGPAKYYGMVLLCLIIMVQYAQTARNIKLLTILSFIATLISKRYTPLLLVSLLPLVPSAFNSLINKTVLLKLNAQYLFPIYIASLVLFVAVIYAPLNNVILASTSYNSPVKYAHSAGIFNSLVRAYPYEALSLMSPDARIFNLYEWGGYISWHRPGSKIFIDGRGDNLDLEQYSLLSEYFYILNGNSDSLLKLAQYKINHVLLPSEYPLIVTLSHDKNWVKKYEHNGVTMFVLNSSGNGR